MKRKGQRHKGTHYIIPIYRWHIITWQYLWVLSHGFRFTENEAAGGHPLMYICSSQNQFCTEGTAEIEMPEHYQDDVEIFADV